MTAAIADCFINAPSEFAALRLLSAVRTTAKGFVAYDANDKPIGTYYDALAAVAACPQQAEPARNTGIKGVLGSVWLPICFPT